MQTDMNNPHEAELYKAPKNSHFYRIKLEAMREH